MRNVAIRKSLQKPFPVATGARVAEALKNIVPTTYSQLANGFRIASEHRKDLEFSTIGVWIDAGSRFETRRNNGTAHFLEHMNFKGTRNYTRQMIENTFERSGGHLNAYTSRDRTAYYIKCFNGQANEVMRLLADILRFGKYPPRDLEQERNTIMSEMREVEELVDEVIMDNLHISAFDPTHCGLPLTILGSSDNILRHINRDMILEYVTTHYTGPRMNLVSVGGLSHSEVEAIAQKYFGDMSSANNRPILAAKYTAGDHKLWNNKMMTSHVAWAFPICGAKHPDSIPLQLVQTLMGSYHKDTHDLSFHQGLNQSHCFSPDVEAVQPFYTPYEDTSLIGQYFVTVPTEKTKFVMDKLCEVTLSQLYRLCREGPSHDALEAAKANFKAGLLLQGDSTVNVAEDLGRQMIHFGRKVPMEEVWSAIDAVTPSSLSATLHKYLFNVRPTMSGIGHPDTLPTYDSLLHVATKLQASGSHSSPQKV